MSRAGGFNLVELMVGLAISLVLMSALLLVLQRSQQAFTRNESLARMQDAARQALAVLADDIEHAGFFGFSHGRRYQLVRAGSVLALEPALRQPDASTPVAAVSGLPANAHDCGVNFAVDLSLPVQGSDQGYALGSGARDCAPTSSAGGASLSADTLTLRFASRETTTARAGRVQLYAGALSSFAPLLLFADGQAPGPIDSTHEVRDLEVRSYYIANSSVDRPGWPALRVKALTESRGACQFRDEEVMTGVEDLQVEFGVASNAGVQFRAPGNTGQAAIVSVRLWLRLRADVTEPGYRDDSPLHYANTSFAAAGSDAAHRRLLVSRIIALRNT